MFAFVRVAATLVYVARTFRFTLRFDRVLFTRQLSYAGPFGLAVLLYVVHTNLHQYIVSYRFDAATFAVYAVGCLQIPFVELVAASAGNVLMVRMAQAAREGQPQQALEIWHDATRKLALMFFPLVGVLLVAAPDLIVLLFTEQYRASAAVFMVSTTGIALAALATDAVLRVYAQTGYLLALNAFRLAFIAALIAPFIAVFDLPGAMLVTILATATAKWLALVRMQRLIGAGRSQLLPWRSLGATAAAAMLAAVAGLAAKLLLGGTAFRNLIAATVVAAGVYAVLVLWLGLLDREEREALTGWLHWRAITGGQPVVRSRS